MPKTAEDFSVSGRLSYDAPVFGLGNLGRRCFESVVGLFAVLGFLYVPLGHHTGFEHAKAVLSTPAATAAIEDVTRAALSIRERAVAYVTGRAAVPPTPEAAPKSRRSEPRAVPPKLK
ncbi:MAG: hypothetical protein K0R38_6575 [Polyangiaceae bacterium]|nr:hypothetical protein [Polyangiaceae bacterium]